MKKLILNFLNLIWKPFRIAGFSVWNLPQIINNFIEFNATHEEIQRLFKDADIAKAKYLEFMIHHDVFRADLTMRHWSDVLQLADEQVNHLKELNEEMGKLIGVDK
jgi:hypothetical protein